MIMLSMVLQSAGLPVEGVALIMSVERIVDMFRTSMNVTGDVVCTFVNQEKLLDYDRYNNDADTSRRDRKSLELSQDPWNNLVWRDLNNEELFAILGGMGTPSTTSFLEEMNRIYAPDGTGLPGLRLFNHAVT